MGIAGAAKEVKEKYGDITDEDFYKDLFKDGPPLCGQTCAYLATGRGKELRGFYIGKSHCVMCIFDLIANCA